MSDQVIHDDVPCPQWPAWSQDGHTVYFVDSAARAIYRAEYSSKAVLGR
nr:SMP-30/gluconolactonase/LRE family protein [Pseudomonas peli]